MIDCYVIGELSTVELLCDYINSYPDTELKGFAFNAPDGFSPVFSIKPDIVFLDSALLKSYEPWLSRIRQFASIIIISDDTLKAFEAFENLAFDYLLKPLPFDRFIKSIYKYNHLAQLAKVGKRVEKHMITDSFFIKADSRGQKEILIKCQDLIYVEALQNYVILHMSDGAAYTCYNSMKEMEDSLPEVEFIRVHKSYIINDSKIVSIEGNTISLMGSKPYQVLIGNTYRKAFSERKNKRMIKKERQPLQVAVHSKIALSLSIFFIALSQYLENLIADALIFISL
ncbi:LytTR family DNA-binding domain-containing protein [Pedobacter aquatilis]|uniref:LytR/AlgR family response regulator transcription factor n=1 Tax=Pedobacter aquatilis TaxID=351343 RepID=UPI0025B53029|nr:LytTR family DNA-binding domain-containing protein [Pedobacter aquatilis]MDN3588077.1 LytTR family DNA-binding domain-containing protein [Pedobacter aquatilis]